MIYCTNEPCETEAVRMVIHHDKEGNVISVTPLCRTCATAYTWGQASPEANVMDLEEYESYLEEEEDE